LLEVLDSRADAADVGSGLDLWHECQTIRLRVRSRAFAANPTTRRLDLLPGGIGSGDRTVSTMDGAPVGPARGRPGW
jgi:hypothetical protein